MKANPEHRKIPAIINKFSDLIHTRAAAAWITAFTVCLTAILINANHNRVLGGSFDEFEAGKVASRDVIADQDIVYMDEHATMLRIEAQLRLVPGVFFFSEKITLEQKARWARFRAISESNNEASVQAYRQAVQSEFQGYFTDEFLGLLHENPGRDSILDECALLLDMMLDRGIFSLPQTGLENLNQDTVELIRQSAARVEQERIPRQNITTLAEAADMVAMVSAGMGSQDASLLVQELAGPFLKENVFYSREETALKMEEVRLRTEPVMRSIDQGKRIIKKDFVITEEEMAELRAMHMTLSKSDLPRIFSNVLFLILLFSLLWYFSGRRIIGRELSNREVYLVSSLSALYIAGSVILGNFSIEPIPVSVVVPTALVIMLPSILIHPRLALLLAMALPLGPFLIGSFNAQSYIFAMVSGVAAAYSLQDAEKRMDLVKAGLFIAAANIVSVVAILLWQHSPAVEYPSAVFWVAFNGVASGMLVLGALPPLEHALNSATTFRLIELSDLNAPILRRLFTTAPGTYSHSIMVASLAEAACQKIDANFLLARVGAYYHDLGKMENPEYFVENQTDHNRHDDIAPRLSATVIRSHVKLGVEKARQLGLPSQVIDIIGEHHGNSIITWFYDKALKQEDGNTKKAPVNTDDFRYMGSPPRSRESAVVMLADVTEAAVRTIEKPTAVKIEKFIQELFEQKQEHGQLAQSELTFMDLGVIKNAFVQVLMGYYHSRIEYPKTEEQQ